VQHNSKPAPQGQTRSAPAVLFCGSCLLYPSKYSNLPNFRVSIPCLSGKSAGRNAIFYEFALRVLKLHVKFDILIISYM
jgi:hypothetical protein